MEIFFIRNVSEKIERKVLDKAWRQVWIQVWIQVQAHQVCTQSSGSVFHQVKVLKKN